MSEEHIIRNCAPTLAGIKTGSTFVCSFDSPEQLRASLRSTNRKLSGKGVRVVPLRIRQNRALIYVYRPRALQGDLSDAAAEQILREQGYHSCQCGKCLSELIRRVQNGAEFPHEIGLFLGYPPEDVRGFMDNGACEHKCVGCWKVYGDEEAARKRFEQYKKCTRVYRDCWARGSTIERLTVAG